ncbi:hypothetical protein QQS21_012688 [Conoideocrella luteorostrata]|uniref:JmjC domain-containing protein n=1 Tax=Conoideocrella luteorostrata TaxID=1105319 RepID=A0AAJ0FMF8_9HYPO|nr:hypothetical protein QQS21_012688 [Conoideocrella luteorostrata]
MNSQGDHGDAIQHRAPMQSLTGTWEAAEICRPFHAASKDAHVPIDASQRLSASAGAVDCAADIQQVQDREGPTPSDTPDGGALSAASQASAAMSVPATTTRLEPVNKSNTSETAMPSTAAAKAEIATLHKSSTTRKSSRPVALENGPVKTPVLPDTGDPAATLLTGRAADRSAPTALGESSTKKTTATSVTTHPTVEPDINYDYDEAVGHRILRLKPTQEQWEDFPAVLAYARRLGAQGDGCFKVIIPDELHEALPEKPAQHVAANAYRVKLIRRTRFWQISTVPSEGVFASSHRSPNSSDSVEALLKNLKHLFRKNQNKQLRNIRYRVDVPAWTKTQRRLAGVPEQSPIYPLKGDKLDDTKAVIPGIHTPYVYESGPYFGATFQIHAEDFRLASLNHLYKGRKIWIIVPATAVDVAEEALGRGVGCSQFMRHRAEFFFPDKLQKLGIPYRIVDQRPGETIVILPDAYHEGFSCGYTIAEAKNYADTAWTTDSYQPCQASCMLATAIPAAFMRPLKDGEQRLDLCAAYGDALSIPSPSPPGDEGGGGEGEGGASKKRDYEDMDRSFPLQARDGMAQDNNSSKGTHNNSLKGKRIKV